MNFKKIIAVYSNNKTEPLNTLFARNADLLYIKLFE
jgi:hypothetical protein